VLVFRSLPERDDRLEKQRCVALSVALSVCSHLPPFFLTELLVGPPIKRMLFDEATRTIVVYCEHSDKVLMVCAVPFTCSIVILTFFKGCIGGGKCCLRFGFFFFFFFFFFLHLTRCIVAYECHVQGLRLNERTCGILHGPMVSLVQLDKPGGLNFFFFFFFFFFLMVFVDVGEKPVLVAAFKDSEFVNVCAFSPDGSFLVSCTCQPKILLTPRDDAASQKWIQAHSDSVTALCWCRSSDRSYLFTGSRDGGLRRWLPQTGESSMKELQGHSSMVTNLLVCSGDKILLSSSQDNTIMMWHVDTCEVLATLRLNRMVLFLREHENVIFSFHENGDVIAWRLLLDAASLKPSGFETVHVGFLGHHGSVTEAVFSGPLMITSSVDGTLRLWRIDSGDCLAVLRGHHGPVTSCAINGDQKCLYSSSQDGLLLSWDVSRWLGVSTKVAPVALEAPILSSIIGCLRCGSSMLAHLVFHWLDPFLEASAERADDEDEASEPSTLEGLSDSAPETEQESLNNLRAVLRGCTSDSDLWQVYNSRKAIYAIAQGIGTSVKALEAISPQQPVEEIVESLRSILSTLLFVFESQYLPNLSMIVASTVLFKRPKLVSVWERRLGTPVPNALLRDTILLVPDLLRSLFVPCGVLMRDVPDSARPDVCAIVSMLSRMWSVCSRAVQETLSWEQCKSMWGELTSVRFCERTSNHLERLESLCDSMASMSPSLFSSLDAKNYPSVCSLSAALISDDGSDLLSFSPEAYLGCVLDSLSKMDFPLFADLHEFQSDEDVSAMLNVLGEDEYRVLAKVCGIFCGFERNRFAGALIGPLLSQSASDTEAVMAGTAAVALLDMAPSFGYPCMTGSGGEIEDTQLAPFRAHIGHEYDCAHFASIGYSLQLTLSSDKAMTKLQLLQALKEKSQVGAREVKVVRRTSRNAIPSSRKAFPGLNNRKSLVIEEAIVADSNLKRRSALEISPGDFAAALLGEDSRSLSNSEGNLAQLRKNRHRKSVAKTAPSFSWNELIGLIDEDDDAIDSSSAAPNVIASPAVVSSSNNNSNNNNNSALSGFGDWGEEHAQGVVGLTFSEVEVDEAGEEIASEMRSFLGLTTDERESWQQIIDEEEDDGEMAQFLAEPGSQPPGEGGGNPVPRLMKPTPLAALQTGGLSRNSDSPIRRGPVVGSSHRSSGVIKMGSPTKNASMDSFGGVPLKQGPKSSSPTAPARPNTPVAAARPLSSSSEQALSSSPAVAQVQSGFVVHSPLAPRKPPPRPPAEKAPTPKRSSELNPRPRPVVQPSVMSQSLDEEALAGHVEAVQERRLPPVVSSAQRRALPPLGGTAEQSSQPPAQQQPQSPKKIATGAVKVFPTIPPQQQQQQNNNNAVSPPTTPKSMSPPPPPRPGGSNKPPPRPKQ